VTGEASVRERASLLEVVLGTARRASALIMQVYAAPFDVDFKGADDPVTRADREANALICAALARDCPGVPIVAEESDPSAYAGYASAPAAWFVDPLDGTREFVAKNGEFAVMIGLAEGGRPTLGVIVCPAFGRAFVGSSGVGAYEVALDGSRAPIHVSGAKALGEARLLMSRSRGSMALEELAARLGFAEVKRCGSAGVKATRIAAGEAEVYAQPGRAGALWDACAPEALVTAAGGAVTDARGTIIDYAAGELPNHHGFVATNAHLHPAVLDLLARFGPPQVRPAPGEGP
jgi:3'(2'), 5'-bisphosphate nucleotidase